MNEYYVWDTEVAAQAALDFINGSGWFPLVGRNAGSGALEPDKQATTSWADAVRERVDGKWIFHRIPTEVLDHVGVLPEHRQAFLDAFVPTVEEYQDDWFPVEEGIE